MDAIKDQVKQAIWHCKRAKPSCSSKQLCKDAYLLDDVLHIIASTPDGLVSKAGEASRWLHSVCTGARAITAANIHLGDIVAFQPKLSSSSSNNNNNNNNNNDNISYHHQEDAFSAPPLYFLSLYQQVTKGIPNRWNHVVTFEGYLTPPSPLPSSSSQGSSSSPSSSSSSPLRTATAMISTAATTTTATSTTSTASICLGDFIYWLNKHLLCKHGLDLHEFHNWCLMC
ncbi:REJ domain-containing protein [Balamuthia mandrillaris]